MKFELTHNEINFILSLEVEENYIPHERFDRISPQTALALKKNELKAYSIIVQTEFKNEIQTFYWNSVLLTANTQEIIDELYDFINDEDILDTIEKFWKDYFLDNPNPRWAK
jgi:hypothetical protein